MNHQTKRIVSLLPSATEIVFGLGLQDQLVGASHECNWPPEVKGKPQLTRSNVDSTASSGQIDRQVKTLMKAGSSLHEVDAELLVSLAPDLIITQTQCDVCAVSYESVLDIVSSNVALNSTSVIALNPTSLAAVLEDITRIGAATGAIEAARRYRENLQQRIDTVVANRPQESRRLRTLVIEWTEPLMIAGNWTPGLVELAGGEYGLAKAREPSRYVDWSEVVDFAPEVLVIAPCGFDLQRSEEERRQLAQAEPWQRLPAVRSGQVYAVDGDALFNRSGPRLVDSLEMLADWFGATPQ